MRVKPSQLNQQRRELEALEDELRQRKLIHDSSVQTMLDVAYKTWNQKIFESAMNRLRLFLETENTQDMRTFDAFRPYCPESLSRTGSLHLLDQMDGIPIHIDLNKLLTGMLVLGPQQAGKSRFIIHLCQQIMNINPGVKITIIDPKGGFSHLDSFINIDLSDISFDLAPPANISPDRFIYELMPMVGDMCGLIYAIEILNEAAWITLSQCQEYNEQSRSNTSICLADIYESISRVNATGPRRPGYRDAAKTAVSRILGQSKLFRCRQGLSLNWLLNHNTVIDARNLTDEWECRFLIIFFLFWLYQRSRFEPETNEIKQVVIIDDASRFIAAIHQYESHTKTSVLGHILAVLRSTGTCLIAATQLPAQVDPAVLALSRNMVVVGNINGVENINIIKSAMSLTDERAKSITEFQRRETLAFISDSIWPHPMHGWVPEVVINNNTATKAELPPISPWHSLTEIPRESVAVEDEPMTMEEPEQNTADSLENNANLDIKGSTAKLVLDCIHYPFDKVRDRTNRLNLSIRNYEAAKTEAEQNGYLIASSCGKTVYLIPTRKAYDELGIPWPYDRSTSVEHAFYVQLAAHSLKQKSSFKVQTETSIGAKGATIDVTTTDLSGAMTAYEITLSTSNLSSNAAKLQDTAYESIIWLCRDAATASAVKAFFNKSTSLPPELLSKFKYIHFSKWISQNKDKSNAGN